MHVGDPLFDERAFCCVRDYVLSAPNRYVVTLGDLINNGLKTSKSNTYREVISPGKQPQKVAELLAPIADRILNFTVGNHEDRTLKDSDVSPTETIADKLYKLASVDVPIVQEAGYIKFRWGKRDNGKPWVAPMWVAHGAGIGTPENMLRKMALQAHARVYLAGHKHKETAFTESLIVPDERNEKETLYDRLFMCAGSFLQYGNYARRGLLRPSRVGCPVISFDSDGKIHASVGGKVV